MHLHRTGLRAKKEELSEKEIRPFVYDMQGRFCPDCKAEVQQNSTGRRVSGDWLRPRQSANLRTPDADPDAFRRADS